MDPINKNPMQRPEEHDPTFQVMPQLGKTPVPTAPVSSPVPPPPPKASLPIDDTISYQEPSGGGQKKLTFIILAVLAMLVIGALAYFLLGKGQAEPETPVRTSKLPVAWMQNYFQSENCGNPAICGDDADPDKDGLKNYDEFRSGTIPVNPDTDADGLADGDEINIYDTDPTLKYTDKRELVKTNDWSDGFQIMNGYDPLTPAIKFTDSRMAQIESDMEKYGQHEPTITTLKTTVQP